MILSSSPWSPPTVFHDTDGSPSGADAVSLQANSVFISSAFCVSPRVRNESALLPNQSLSNTSKLVSNGPSDLPTARQSYPSPIVISLTGTQPSSDTMMGASFQSSTASISLPEKVTRPSSNTRRSYDTSRAAAPQKSRL